MDDHFYSSLHEIKLQLDLMNTRTAAFLNTSQQQPTMSSHGSDLSGQCSLVSTHNSQQIRHIGATVGALVSQQADRLQRLEHQLDALSEKLDDLDLGYPHFTPPESPRLPVSEDPKMVNPCLDSTRIPLQSVTKPPATVIDIGGYFHPNHYQHSHSDQQRISDAFTFVGRVNRALRTKSIANIETFLRGSALRWFHIGLKLDGSHAFDDKDGKMDLAKFCESLTLLFGVTNFRTSETVSYEETRRLRLASTYSVILEDFAFPALEDMHRQSTLDQPHLYMGAALCQAVDNYNQRYKSFTVDSNILRYDNLVYDLARLRSSEIESRRSRGISQERKGPRGSKSAKVQIEVTKEGNSACNRDQQDSVSEFVSRSDRKKSASTSINLQDTHNKRRPTTGIFVQPGASAAHADVAGSATSTRSELASQLQVLMDLVSLPVSEQNPPAPTAESCPTTPATPCQSPSSTLKFASQLDSMLEGLHSTEVPLHNNRQTSQELVGQQSLKLAPLERSDPSRPDKTSHAIQQESHASASNATILKYNSPTSVAHEILGEVTSHTSKGSRERAPALLAKGNEDEFKSSQAPPRSHSFELRSFAYGSVPRHARTGHAAASMDKRR